ncbi:AzlC family ABC transporter permease [Vibrio hippocampi]|uniref:Inner membrane protein YgaZ n=1 Tax=Vibrio hippocampi TaxID=654686 RepID=A0ABM8ZLJ6_9VIBR|nr:AzlC family ABC transporter permease [Vibrio hippocampi]CAH0529307.1 Inner membrane protein YgaZ [Vibrio hippocampi]
MSQGTQNGSRDTEFNKNRFTDNKPSKNEQTDKKLSNAWLLGVKDAIPLMSGYIPVAISFGLISLQSGFGIWETIVISSLIYAGASQFLFVAMVASGAPILLVIVMTLLVNARHLVYGPNIAPYLNRSRWWIPLMHGLTDQIFALALTRFPQLSEPQRIQWYTSAAVIAWLSWILGTALGVIVGSELVKQWPLLGEILPFALPALFLVLLAPKFDSIKWTISLLTTTAIAVIVKLYGFPNLAIPLAAVLGTMLFYVIKHLQHQRGES